MTCEEVERDELVEQYVLGRLEPDRQAAFEDHYFNCSACLERLQVVEQARGELAAAAARPNAARWRRVAAGLAAAATLVVALRVGQDMWRNDEATPPSAAATGSGAPSAPASEPPAVSPSASLGAIELPAYTPLRLRSTTSEAERAFREAMEPYAMGNCAAAIPGLRRALELDMALRQARFYLAACELHSGRVDDAVGHLQRVVGSGESPYLEDARFFLAKARIRQGNIAAAREELTRVIALNGDRRDEARRLLEQLR